MFPLENKGSVAVLCMNPGSHWSQILGSCLSQPLAGKGGGGKGRAVRLGGACARLVCVMQQHQCQLMLSDTFKIMAGLARYHGSTQRAVAIQTQVCFISLLKIMLL